MEIKENDVKVFGRVVSVAIDNKVASSEQVYDDTFEDGMFQSEINKKLVQKIDEISISGGVESISNDEIDRICTQL